MGRSDELRRPMERHLLGALENQVVTRVAQQRLRCTNVNSSAIAQALGRKAFALLLSGSGCGVCSSGHKSSYEQHRQQG